MKLKTWLAALAATVTLGFVAVPAQAAPGDGLHGFATPAAQNTDVQKVWYHRHYRYYYYGPHHHYWRHHYYYGPRYHRYWHRW